MSPQHHPSDALVADYASGAMDPARALVMASHVHACPLCRERVALAESVGGALVESLPPAELAGDALQRALAALDAPEPPPPAPSPPATAPAGWIAVPPEVAAAARRRRWVAPGVWVAPVLPPRPGRPLSYLLRVGPGMRMPEHTHHGTELTLVLTGAFLDGDDRYGAGDLAEADDDVRHSPHIAREGPCVSLVACDHPLVTDGRIARLVQAYAGI